MQIFHPIHVDAQHTFSKIVALLDFILNPWTLISLGPNQTTVTDVPLIWSSISSGRQRPFFFIDSQSALSRNGLHRGFFPRVTSYSDLANLQNVTFIVEAENILCAILYLPLA